MNPRFLILLILSVTFFSCKKNDSLIRGHERLSKSEILTSSGQVYSSSEYNYNSTGNLTAIIHSGSLRVVQQINYNQLGQLQSSIVSNSVVGDQYKFDFHIDGIGRIIKAIGTALQPNTFIDNHTYTYDPKGRLLIDSVFTQSGTLNSFVNFEYDNNDNVVAYQQFISQGTSFYSPGRWTFQYDRKRSPFNSIGQLLYTSIGGGGVSYFLLSKNNLLKMSLNDNEVTPGRGFKYEYYGNSLLKTSTVKEANALVETYYYTE
jgi:hypothetical protein